MHLRVVIKNVRHLPKMDVLGTCDPYVVLSFGNQKYQTSTKYNTYNPDYEEEFLFNVDDTNATEILTIDLIDWDRLTEHDYIGSVQLDLSSIISSLGDAGDSLEKTCPLRNLRDSSATAVKRMRGASSPFCCVSVILYLGALECCQPIIAEFALHTEFSFIR